MFADIPFSAITEDHLVALIDNRVREGRRLDFKRELLLGQTDQNLQVIRDVIAMANTDGGAIVYGIEEGEDEDAGAAIRLDGIAGNQDQISNMLDNLLRDCVDEKIPGVLHRPVPLANGRFAYIIWTPPSPLAPHMIAGVRTSHPRFFSRANTTNEPMTARQIKDAVRRHEGAMERAQIESDLRTDVLRKQASHRKNPYNNESISITNQVVLHLIPLYPYPQGWNYGDEAVAERLQKVSVFGPGRSYDRLRYTQQGAFLVTDHMRHIGYLRSGGLEFQRYDVLSLVNGGRLDEPIHLIASDIEQDVDEALRNAERLTRDAMLPTPLLVQLRFLDVKGSRFRQTRHFTSRETDALGDIDVETASFILHEWSERDLVLRNLLDHMWQAWGFPRCQHFYEDGSLMKFDTSGYRVKRPDETENE